MMALEVWTVADLDNVRNNLIGEYIQMANIDLVGMNWIPIGNVTGRFSGIYDGNGFTISNLSIQDTAITNGIGLFGQSEGYCSFRNITLDQVNVVGNGYYQSALIGHYYSIQDSNFVEITNCHVKNMNLVGSGNSLAIGGLIGESGVFKIENCTVQGSMKGIINLGGFVGLSLAGAGVSGIVRSKFYRCFSNIVITGDEYIRGWFGGLLGAGQYIDFSECYSMGSIEAIGLYDYPWSIGGITSSCGNCTFTNCYARMNIKSTFYVGNNVGGFVGYTVGSTFLNCYSTGIIDYGVINNLVVGFCPSNNESIVNCYYDLQNATLMYNNNGSALPKTTEEMKQQITFVDWDFATVWKIRSLLNDGYPCFMATPELPPETPPECMDILWETPESDFGSPGYLKIADMFYCTLQGSGQIRVDFIFDGNIKSLTLDCPIEETIIRKRIRHKGKLIKLVFSNVGGNKFTMKNPVLMYEVIEDSRGVS